VINNYNIAISTFENKTQNIVVWFSSNLVCKIWRPKNKKNNFPELENQEWKNGKDLKIFFKHFFDWGVEQTNDLKNKIKIELNGTEFQRKVWNRIKDIEVWNIISYKELAENIWSKAIQAVGTACGKNPLPMLIPCHRVVASGWKIGGWSGKISKEIMLKNEWIIL
jgi:O-6-methylguanine DNA methyltransferase